MRPPSVAWICRKLMLWSSVAGKTLIGMVTRPNDTAPDHTGRGIVHLLGGPPGVGCRVSRFVSESHESWPVDGRSDPLLRVAVSPFTHCSDPQWDAECAHEAPGSVVYATVGGWGYAMHGSAITLSEHF